MTIIIIKPDKAECDSKMEDILQDTNKFKPLLDDLVMTTIKRENNTNLSQRT